MKKTILYAVCAVAVIAVAAFVIVGCDGDMGERSETMDAFLDKFHYNKQKVKKFTVTYDGNGATGDVPIDKKSPYDSGWDVYTMYHGSLENGDLNFLRWSTMADGDAKGARTYGENVRFNITEDVILYAQWGAGKPYEVTVNTFVASTNASGGGNYTPGEKVTINAGTPPNGWRFDKWTTTTSGVSFADDTSAITTFTMPAYKVIVTARFVFVAGGDMSWFTDYRDGKTYSAVTIGEQTWMAQNLDYMTEDGSSWCYDNDPDHCNKYGRLYTWDAALNACPAGWYLPSLDEWETLISAIGGPDEADDKLKSTDGWEINGTDNYGFRALPGGDYYDGTFSSLGGSGEWWTATSYGNGVAHTKRIQNGSDYLIYGGVYMRSGHSVRCIKDNNTYTVTVSAGTGATGSGNYLSGATVTIKAGSRPDGMPFRKWTSSNSQVVFADANSATTTFIMPSAEVTVTANFSGMFTDSRDSKTYKAVTIGGKIWMAENLNYPTSSGSWCYADSPDSCAKYGRLYDWNTALTVCPIGWHLSTRQDWGNLVITAGGTDTYGTGGMADKALKSTTGWNNDCNWSDDCNGTDTYGFSALPAGGYYTAGGFDGAGGVGIWWTADTEYSSGNAYYRVTVSFDNTIFESGTDNKGDGFSVRCVKDD